MAFPFDPESQMFTMDWSLLPPLAFGESIDLGPLDDMRSEDAVRLAEDVRQIIDKLIVEKVYAGVVQRT